MSEFKKRFFGKWVLSGEHSVLRGGPALVYPLSSYYMDFHYKESAQPLRIKKQGSHSVGLDFAISPLLDKAINRASKKREDLTGLLTVKNFIPFGAGLGASAAMCAGMASLFLHKGWIPKKRLRALAISLEDYFHGKSSGMDVALALEKKPLLYQKGRIMRFLPKFKTKPILFLSYSGGRASTAVGVSQVSRFFRDHKSQAQLADKNMAQSVRLCVSALQEKGKDKLNKLLTQALALGESCFRQWSLISYDLEKHSLYLKKRGALAVKPTGSGLGGYVISLWDKAPPLPLRAKLIPLNDI